MVLHEEDVMGLAGGFVPAVQVHLGLAVGGVGDDERLQAETEALFMLFDALVQGDLW